MKRFLCNKCDSQLIISHDNKELFKYNTQCPNGHINKSVSLKDMMGINENIFKCQEHKKFAVMYCFTCKKEICLYCFQNSHSNHNTKFFHHLKKDEVTSFTKIMTGLKYLNDNFFIELEYFNKNNSNNVNLDSLKSIFEREYDILFQIVNNDNLQRVTYIDITNIINIFKPEHFEKYINFFNKFNSFDTYLEKYEYLKIIFPDIVKDKTKFIEPLPSTNTKIYEILKYRLIPIKENYYIKLEYENKKIVIIKDISTDQKHFEYQILFSINCIIERHIILPEIDIIVQNLLSFFYQKLIYIK